MPLTTTLGALIGVLVTSAARSLYGEVIWSPLALLQHTQHVNYTPGCRAATFFAGLAMLSSQVFVNVTQNGIQQGMDIVAFFPRYFTIRRGAMLVMVVGILIQPWRFLSQASSFLTVLSGFGTFTPTLAGVMLADYWLVRREKIVIPDLYRTDGCYWYSFGLHWRGFLAFALSTWMSMPGFVAAVGGPPASLGWVRINQLTFFIGLIMSTLIYWALCKVSPPPRLGDMVMLKDDEIMVLQGMVEAGVKEAAADLEAEKEAGVDVSTTNI